MLVYTLQYVHIKYLDGLVNKQNNKFLSSHYTVLHPGFASYTTLVVFVRFLRWYFNLQTFIILSVFYIFKNMLVLQTGPFCKICEMK